MDCVDKSIANCYVNPEGSSMPFTEWKPEHDIIRTELFQKVKLLFYTLFLVDDVTIDYSQRDGNQNGKNILSWVSSGVSKIFSIKY
jgi:hypothetical protein